MKRRHSTCCLKYAIASTQNDDDNIVLELNQGETNRVIGAHSLNASSSRSHCVFTIHIEVSESYIIKAIMLVIM